MQFRLLSLSLLVCLPAAAQIAASSAEPAHSNGLAEYREGNFDAAIPLLKGAVAAAPEDAALQAALLSSLTYKANVEEAADADEFDAQKFPQSAPVLVARGEFAFYMGDMQEAKKLFGAALKLQPGNARAHYGYSRFAHAAGFYRSSRMLALKAHEEDPGDALIIRLWMTYLTPELQRNLFPSFAAAHPWLYKYAEMERESGSAIQTELSGRKAFELDGPRQEVTLHLTPLITDGRIARGVGLRVKIEDRRLLLLFDTGASGIVVTQHAVDKAGLSHLGSGKSWGVGDQGERDSFSAVSDACEIGDLKFRHCVLGALAGKRRIDSDADGLVGADVFSSYLIGIDFQKLTLHLTPLPPREPNAQGYDREAGPDEKDFTPVFRFGHSLLLPTTLNGQATGLFLLDTGASMSTVDSTFAQFSTKIRKDEFRKVRGISGDVKQVFEADKAVLQFANFRQENLGLAAINLNNRDEHSEYRLSGILGLPVLSIFRLTLDYRNNLVKFDYVFEQKKSKR